MSKPLLYRQRIIPKEIIQLKDDEILFADENKIVTRWNTLRPKEEFDHGCSCYFLKEGFKVSKFYKKDGTLIYWYCDIISYSYNEDDNSYIFTDLLADVLVYPNGRVEVVDVDEIADAIEDGTLTKDQMIPALRSLDRLLRIIYAGDFGKLKRDLEEVEEAAR